MERFRFRLVIEYDGRPYRGWQSQAGGNTIQDRIEWALGKLKEDGRRLICAGRTDAGVHALGQVAHVDLAKDWPEDVLRDALNAHLAQADEAISILDARRALEIFSARLSCTGRHYRYIILNRRAVPALARGRAFHVIKPLDIEAMRVAAHSILGKHDFTTFRAANCQAKSPIRTLDRLDVFRAGEEVHVEASARSFLHHQVRSMVGSLVKIGRGQWPVEEMRAILDARDRARCGPVAPPDGLYFLRADYADGA